MTTENFERYDVFSASPYQKCLVDTSIIGKSVQNCLTVPNRKTEFADNILNVNEMSASIFLSPLNKDTKLSYVFLSAITESLFAGITVFVNALFELILLNF